MIGCTKVNNISQGNESAAVFRIRADAGQTTTGGIPITLAVEHEMNNEPVTWHLDPQSPGKLDEINGDTVRYLPPAAGTITGEAQISITATVNGLTQHIELLVLPWPEAVLSVKRGARLLGSQVIIFA